MVTKRGKVRKSKKTKKAPTVHYKGGGRNSNNIHSSFFKRTTDEIAKGLLESDKEKEFIISADSNVPLSKSVVHLPGQSINIIFSGFKSPSRNPTNWPKLEIPGWEFAQGVTYPTVTFIRCDIWFINEIMKRFKTKQNKIPHVRIIYTGLLIPGDYDTYKFDKITYIGIVDNDPRDFVNLDFESIYVEIVEILNSNVVLRNFDGVKNIIVDNGEKLLFNETPDTDKIKIFTVDSNGNPIPLKIKANIDIMNKFNNQLPFAQFGITTPSRYLADQTARQRVAEAKAKAKRNNGQP